MNRFCFKKSWAIFLFAIAATIFSFAKSTLFLPLYAQHIDSQVYIHTAQEVLNGKVLYKDVFDHKGPAMYVFECLGYWLHAYNLNGIWLVQLISLLIGLLPLLFYLQRRGGVVLAMSSLLVFLSWIYRFNRIGDNIPEVYSLGLVSLYFYLLLTIIDNQFIAKKYQLIGIGMLTVFLVLFKLNFAIVVIPSLIYLFIQIVKITKNISFLIWLIVGAVACLLPFVFYFSYHHALYEAFYAIWIFNLNYVSTQSISFFQSIWDVFYFQIFFISFLIALISFSVFYIKKERSFFIILIITFVSSILVLVGLSGRGADSIHYVIPLAPVVLLLFFYAIFHIYKKFIFLWMLGAVYFFKPVVVHYFDKNVYTNSYEDLISYINLQKKEGETLCVIGNYSCLYDMTKLPSNTPYFYTYPILSNPNNDIYKKFLQRNMDSKANWLALQIQYPPLKDEKELLKNYELVKKFASINLYHLNPNNTFNSSQ
ncbi:MAG: hypothetical protein IT215_01965 [Chitinophagaceae bacterium]|nr:hypothetical protein [Chitinophagaceae bacterium]HMN33603.1 hypothetical protein [Chitinophagaceae bacterium]